MSKHVYTAIQVTCRKGQLFVQHLNSNGCARNPAVTTDTFTYCGEDTQFAFPFSGVFATVHGIIFFRMVFPQTKARFKIT